MDESQVLRALGMSIDLMRPVAAATPALLRQNIRAYPPQPLPFPRISLYSPLVVPSIGGIEMAHGSRSL